MDQPTPPYYDKRLPDGTRLDVYAICQLYGVCQIYGDTSPPVFHAIKKLLRAGKGSGGKSLRQDVAEARDALNRFLEMTVEDEPAPAPSTGIPHPNREEVERGLAEGRFWRWRDNDGGQWSNWFDSSHKPMWLRSIEYELAPIEPS